MQSTQSAIPAPGATGYDVPRRMADGRPRRRPGPGAPIERGPPMPAPTPAPFAAVPTPGAPRRAWPTAQPHIPEPILDDLFAGGMVLPDITRGLSPAVLSGPDRSADDADAGQRCAAARRAAIANVSLQPITR